MPKSVEKRKLKKATVVFKDNLGRKHKLNLVIFVKDLDEDIEQQFGIGASCSTLNIVAVEKGTFSDSFFLSKAEAKYHEQE